MTAESAKKAKHALAAHSLLNMVPASQLSLAALRRQ